jgi:Cu/Ag efflux protein CusF
MKKSRISIALAFAVLATPVAVIAQQEPQAAVLAATAPGKAAVGEVIQLQGKVTSIDKAKRVVVVTGPQGNHINFNCGEEVRNFDQIRVGDLVTLTYAHALALDLRKVANNGIRERVETEQSVRAKPGEKPGAAVEKTVQVIANVVAVNPKAQTVTLRGVKRTVELAVNDPAQLKEIKVGDQVEATYVEAVALEVTAAKRK